MLDAGLDLAWTEGYVAGYAAQPMTANPYGNDAEASDVWITGWRLGRADEIGERGRGRRAPEQPAAM